MNNLSELFSEGVRRVGIAGHVRPDGDCVGSCAALYLYIGKRYPEISVDLYLEEPKSELQEVPGASAARSEADAGTAYDLFILCDVSAPDRIGVARELFERASRTACIDHHISNAGLADANCIMPEASSTAEVLFGLMDGEWVDKETAQALYTGIIHDSGVFQYRNTSPATLRCAAALLERGFDATAIIDKTFNSRSFVQNQILGFALETAELFAGGHCVITAVTKSDRERCGAALTDLDLIVAELRMTEGVTAAAFLYETESGEFKVSLRSNDPQFDVSAVASRFGGGGHRAAAGFTAAPPLAAARMQTVEALQAALVRMNGSI